MPSVKKIEKLYAGIGFGRAFAKQKLAKPHARWFDEGGLTRTCLLLYLYFYFPVAEENCNSESG
jgi:hypothetical protein